MSGRTPRWATRPPQKRAGRLSNLRAPRPARLPNPKPTTINPKDSRYDRGTTGGQVSAFGVRAALFRTRPVNLHVRPLYKCVLTPLDHPQGQIDPAPIGQQG